jgi:hypothetical protein
VSNELKVEGMLVIKIKNKKKQIQKSDSNGNNYNHGIISFFQERRRPFHVPRVAVLDGEATLFDWIAVLLCKGGDGWLKKKGGGGDVTIR